MKILFVHTPPDLYGASRSLLRLTSKLVEDSNNVYVLLVEKGNLYGELISKGVKVILHPELVLLSRDKVNSLKKIFKNLISLPRSVIYLKKLFSEINPEIIHSNTSLLLSPAIAAFLSGKKHIWHIREFFSEFGFFWKIYRRIIIALSDKIICVSRAVGDQFPDNKKVIVINNGFPLEEFDGISTERIREFKNTYNLNYKLMVGVVGRIKLLRKGQETFIRAASMLKDKYPQIHFVIIGSPFSGNEDHLLKLKKMIDELDLKNSVTLTGDVEDIKAAISSLDIVVLPSALPEPFGGIVIEAMALCKPVVGTSIGGTIEQITEGENGFLFEAGNYSQLSSKLENLIINVQLRKKMGQSGRNTFLNKFEFTIFYNSIMSQYLSLNS